MTDISAGIKVCAGLFRVSAKEPEFTAEDVLAHAPGDPSPSEGTLYNVLNALEQVGVLERDDRGTKTYWSLVEEPEVSADERITTDSETTQQENEHER